MYNTLEKASRVSAGFGHDTVVINGLTIFTSTIRVLRDSPMYYAMAHLFETGKLKRPNTETSRSKAGSHKIYMTYRWATSDVYTSSSVIQTLNLAKAMVLEMEAWRLRTGEFHWVPEWYNTIGSSIPQHMVDDDLPF